MERENGEERGIWAMYLGGCVVRCDLISGGKSCSICSVSCRHMAERAE